MGESEAYVLRSRKLAVNAIYVSTDTASGMPPCPAFVSFLTVRNAPCHDAPDLTSKLCIVVCSVYLPRAEPDPPEARFFSRRFPTL